MDAVLRRWLAVLCAASAVVPECAAQPGQPVRAGMVSSDFGEHGGEAGAGPVPDAAAVGWPELEARADPGAVRSALADAVASAPESDAAGASADEADAAARATAAALRPRAELQLAGQAVISRRFGGDLATILERSRPDARLDAALSVDQLLTDFGASAARLRAARVRAGARDAQAEAVRNDAALRAGAAWIELAAARQSLGVAEAGRERLRALHARAVERERLGLGTMLDIARVDAALAEIDAEAARAGQAAAAGAERFRRAFGRTAPAGLAQLPPDLWEGASPVGQRPGGDTAVLSQDTREETGRPAATAVQPAASDRPITLRAAMPDVGQLPVVRAARADAEAAAREARAARADRLPRVTLGVDAAKYSLGRDVIDHDIRARVGLSWRFGGGLDERVGAASARSARAEAVLRAVTADAERDLHLAADAARARHAELPLARRAFAAALQLRALEAARVELVSGSVVDLVRAELALTRAALELVAALAAVPRAELRLAAAAGTLMAWLDGG